MSGLLRLFPEDTSRPIDFRKSMWGHALHSSTFRAEPRQRVRRWSWCPWFTVPEPESVRRYRFMVHTSDSPKIGREVIWNVEGGERVGRIYDVEYCYDPRDMMTLKVVVGLEPPVSQ